MSRNRWLTVGLSLLLGTGVGAALPGMGVQTAWAQDVIDDGNIVEHRDWVEIEAPRWGDLAGEKDEIEAPRWGDLAGEQGEIEAPRWGDLSEEQGEIEAPRS